MIEVNYHKNIKQYNNQPATLSTQLLPKTNNPSLNGLKTLALLLDKRNSH
jgi:hypothetical protein